MIPNRKISTYINAMASAGFIIENMIEQTDRGTLQLEGEMDVDRRKRKSFFYLLSSKQERYSWANNYNYNSLGVYGYGNKVNVN